jgi:hypothetical protein
MKLREIALLLTTWVIASSASLNATTVTSTTYSSWLAGTSGPVADVDFTHMTFTNYGPAGYTSPDGFTITGPDGAGTSLQGLMYGGYQAFKGGTDANALIKVATPAAGETALIFVLASNPQATLYTLTLSDGQIFNLPGTTSLFGVSVSHPITYATIGANVGASVILQDVTYAATNLPLDSGGTGGTGGTGGSDPSPVPEATTTLLFGSGLILIASFRKRWPHF